MKIGVDARLLSHAVTGIGRYTAELAKELVKFDAQFFLYLPNPPVVGCWEQMNIKIRAGRFKSRPQRMVWSQTFLPYWAAKDQVDVFWGATHRLPRFLPNAVARVVTIHDLVWKYAGETMRPFSRFMEGRLMPDAIRRADRVIADSHSTAEGIGEEFPWARDRVQVVHLGASRLPEPFERTELTRFGIDRDYFLFVGTLEPRKNLKRLLHAFASLDDTTRNSALLVIAGGKGWGDENVERLVRELGLEKDVRLTGYVDESALATLYAHALFLAMPSLYEGFGLPLVEAMSFGVPVLTANSSSLPEVAGDAGALVDPLDEASIAEGLRKMLLERGFRESLAENTRPTAAKFTWSKAAEATMQIFEEAVAIRKEKRGAYGR